MITGRGIGYLLLIGIAYLTIGYSGFKSLAFLLPLLLALPVLSAVRTWLAARFLVISQILEPAVTEREVPSALTIKLIQQGWLSQGEIDLVTVKPGMGLRRIHERRVMSLLSNTSREFSLDLECRHRGMFQAGISSARSRDLFSLFYLPIISRRRFSRQAAQVIVLPRSAPSAYFDDLADYLYDWQHKQTPDIGNDADAIANIRTHRPGDSLKRTHWKLTARLDEVMVKEFENPVRQAGLILIDMARPAQDSLRRAPCLDLADACTDRAAYLTSLLLSDGNSLRLVNYQADGRHELVLDHPDGLRQAQFMLAMMDWSDAWPVEKALIEETSPERSACFIILITTRLTRETVSQLHDIRQRGRPVWLVLITGKSLPDPELAAAVSMAGAAGLPMTLLDDGNLLGEEASE